VANVPAKNGSGRRSTTPTAEPLACGSTSPTPVLDAGSCREVQVPPQGPERRNHCREPGVGDKGKRREGDRGDQDART
jgi:hypothetical protein